MRTYGRRNRIFIIESAVGANAPPFQPAYLLSCANGFQVAELYLKVGICNPSSSSER